MCSKTGDESSIYAARQGMRACNNRNTIHKKGEVAYVIIVACPHLLSSCIYMYTALVSLLWHCHPHILQYLMEMFLLPCFTGFLLYTHLLFVFVQAPPHFAAHGHVKCTGVITRK